MRGARVVRERVSRGSDEGVMRRSGREIERGLMMTNEDLREQRRGGGGGRGSNRERIGSRVVERACQAAVCGCWGRAGLGLRVVA